MMFFLESEKGRYFGAAETGKAGVSPGLRNYTL
jgi:hypothetical protein